jgi:hypothetical protein
VFLATEIRGVAVTSHNPNALIAVGTAELPAVVLALDIEKAADLARQEKAQATRRAYASDFRIFGAHGAQTVA